MSFYSGDIYRESAVHWKGFALLYLLMLLAFSWIPTFVRSYRSLGHFASTEGQQIVSQLPRVRIENGIMSTDPGGQHVIRDLESGSASEGQAFFIIDDTIDEAPSDITTETFILTRREFGMIRPSRNERRVWQLTPDMDIDVTPEEVQAFLNSLQSWLAPLGYVACVAGSFAFRTLQIFIYGAIGMTMAKKWKANLDYRSLVRLAAVAITPVVVLRTLIWFGPWEPAWYLRWPAAIAISMAYLSFGIRAAAVARSTDRIEA
jgi:hypothetical protein